PTLHLPSSPPRRSSDLAATAKLSDISEITLALPTDSAARLTAVAEGATIGTYSFVGYKTSEDDKAKTHDTVLKFCTRQKNRYRRSEEHTSELQSRFDIV